MSNAAAILGYPGRRVKADYALTRQESPQGARLKNDLKEATSDLICSLMR